MRTYGRTVPTRRPYSSLFARSLLISITIALAADVGRAVTGHMTEYECHSLPSCYIHETERLISSSVISASYSPFLLKRVIKAGIILHKGDKTLVTALLYVQCITYSA